MSATPATQPEVSPLAELLASDLYSNINNFIQILSAFEKRSDWCGLLPVEKVSLVKQLSKHSEHEYFVAEVKL
jgi:hypothetical protein